MGEQLYGRVFESRVGTGRLAELCANIIIAGDGVVAWRNGKQTANGRTGAEHTSQRSLGEILTLAGKV